MSKLGKTYRILSNDEKNRSFITNLRNFVPNGTINIVENFSTQENIEFENYNSFNVSMEIKNFNNQNEIIALQDFLTNLRVTSTAFKHVNFNIDIHYEQSSLQTTVLDQEEKIINGKEEFVRIPYNLENELLKFKSSFEYNFLIKNYENYLSENVSLKENLLPYFYDVLSGFAKSNTYNTFNGTSFFDNPEKIFNIITSSYPPNIFKYNVIPSNVIADNRLLPINKYLEKINIFKEQFPFYTDISFDTHELKKDNFTKIFKNLKSGEQDFLDFIFQQLSASSAGNPQYLGVENVISEEGAENSLGPSSTKYFSLTDLFKNPVETLKWINDIELFQINNLILKNIRSFKQVLEGKPEYSEVIGYRLAKYRGNSSEIIQEWFFPNLEAEKINFIDSQIKYDTEYTYKLHPVVLTFETNYKIIENNLRTNSESGEASVRIKRDINTKIYVLESENVGANYVSSYTNKLLDFPPIEPEVELLPFVGIDNKIKIFLNTAIGSKTVSAIDFSPVEDGRKDELRKAQNKDINNSLLTFQADEPNSSFEIYRITQKPKSYEDFFDSLLATVNTQNASSAAYLDNVLPNTKYYYTFRAIDFHGNISNPTPIYELEILNDNGLIIPYIKLVEFEQEKKNFQSSKDFKKLLKIQPAARHRIVNEGSTATAIQLGSEPNSPWSQETNKERRFKMRLTSKTSGKKIDINFSFKYNDKPTSKD